jgi:hypothetical protein
MENPYLQSLNRLNQEFCKNALKIRLNSEEKGYQNVSEVPDLTREGVEVHRTLLYEHGKKLLFIPDLDFGFTREEREGLSPGAKRDIALPKAYECMEALSIQFPGWEIKFSGNIGFHPMQVIDLNSKEWIQHRGEREAIYRKYHLLEKIERVEAELKKIEQSTELKTHKLDYLLPERERLITKGLNLYLSHVLYAISKHVPKLTVDRDKAVDQKLIWMDLKITSDKMIRGYCINLKSGLFSVPADVRRETVDDILERAALEKPMKEGIDIPEFSLYGLADPRDDIPKFRKILETTRDEINVGGQGRIPQEKFWPCAKKALSLEPQQLSQYNSFFICTYLNKAGYSKKEILEVFRRLYREKFKEEEAAKQIAYITGKRYGFANCGTIRNEYNLCVGNTCFRYKKAFPEEFNEGSVPPATEEDKR